MKTIECGALVPGCDYVARADSEDEAVAMATRHARNVHDIAVTRVVAEKVRQAVRDG